MRGFIKKLILGASVLATWLAESCAYGDITLTTLISFNGTNGASPFAGLVQGTDGNFYGTTYQGGTHGLGTVFQLSTNGLLTTLHSFTGSNDGAHPNAGLVQGTDGNLYGTAPDGGNGLPNDPYSGHGVVFRITLSGVLTRLASFNGTNGSKPWSGPLMEGSDGHFYGTTVYGGLSIPSYPYGYGTVFRVTTNGLLTNLHLFNYINDGIPGGDSPQGGLVEGPDGNFYGTASSGGPLSGGTVFRVTPGGNFTRLVSFSYLGTNGLNPFSALLRGADGNFYGTTRSGGASYGNPRSLNGSGFGMIFKMTPTGGLTPLFSFQSTNGADPAASLVQASDGSFYGTTRMGGALTNLQTPGIIGSAGYGTVFRLTSNGTLTTLISFGRTNGAAPFASLLPGKDGNFYGTTLHGGAYNLGTVFRLGIPAPPAIRCPAAATMECGRPTEMTVQVSDPNVGALTVLWQLNGQPVQTNTIPASNHPTDARVLFSADLPHGTNVIVVSVTDDATNTVSCSTTIVVLDSTPPAILSVAANPNVLWPPTHQMVSVNVNALVEDACGSANWKIVGVQSNEPVSGPGDGKTSPDWVITGDNSVSLRAERSAAGAGRVYGIEIQASDAAGNLSELRVVAVGVPKSQVQRR